MISILIVVAVGVADVGVADVAVAVAAAVGNALVLLVVANVVVAATDAAAVVIVVVVLADAAIVAAIDVAGAAVPIEALTAQLVTVTVAVAAVTVIATVSVTVSMPVSVTVTMTQMVTVALGRIEAGRDGDRLIRATASATRAGMDIGLDGHDGVARLRFQCMHWMQLLLMRMRMLMLMLLHAAAVRVNKQITHPIVDDLLRIVQEERFARDAAIGRGRGIHAPIAHGIHIEPIVGQQSTAPATAAANTTTSANASSCTAGA